MTRKSPATATALSMAFALVAALILSPTVLAKAKRPSLEVRVSPRLAFSPVSVLAVAELKGGEDIEDFYCLAIEWDWDDGSKSLQDSDCEPFKEGTKIDRRFSSEHYYARAGSYNIRATLKSSERVVVRNGFRLTVRQGLPQDRYDREEPYERPPAH